MLVEVLESWPDEDEDEDEDGEDGEDSRLINVGENYGAVRLVSLFMKMACDTRTYLY